MFKASNYYGRFAAELRITVEPLGQELRQIFLKKIQKFLGLLVA